jgi:hypothetical protein
LSEAFLSQNVLKENFLLPLHCKFALEYVSLEQKELYFNYINEPLVVADDVNLQNAILNVPQLDENKKAVVK